MCKIPGFGRTTDRGVAVEASQRATDEALAAERASVLLRAAIPQQLDVLELAGLQPLAGYEVHYWDSKESYPRWVLTGVTVDLPTACGYAEKDGYRVILRKAYRLKDGSLVTAPKFYKQLELP